MLGKNSRNYLLFFVITIFLSAYSNSRLRNDRIEFQNESIVFNTDENDSIAYSYRKLNLLVANQLLINDKDIFFKIYKNQRILKPLKDDETVVRVDLLSAEGKVVKTQNHKMIDGIIHGHMKLADRLTPGSYRLIAYTDLELQKGIKNIASKAIWVGNIEDWDINGKIDKGISVIVEGGTLLANEDNRLILNIKDNTIQGFKDPFHIVDNEGNKVADITQFSKNLGSTIFRPDANKTYFIKQKNGANFALPKPETQGFLLHANNLDDEHIIIKICKGLNSQNENLNLVVYSEDGRISAIKKVTFNLEEILEFKLPKKDIPSGLVELKLIDNSGKELNSRPFWIDIDKINVELIPMITNSSENSFQLKVTDDLGKPISSTIAFSINKFNLNNYSKIKIHRPFVSDIEQFNSNIAKSQPLSDRSISFIRDLAVQSYFNIHKQNSTNINIQNDSNLYLGKNGLILRGIAYDLDNKLLSNSNVRVMALTEKEVFLKETMTDTNGNLEINDLQLTGDSRFIFRKKGETDIQKLVNFIPSDGNINNYQNELYKVMDKEKFDKKSNIKEEFGEAITNNRSEEFINLDEVEVNAENYSKETSAPSVYGIEVPRNKISYQNYDNPRTLAQMLSEIPGVTAIQNNIFGGTVRINRASGPVLWVLDGFTIPQGENKITLGGNVNNSMREILTMVSPKDIERVEVLIGANAAIYGTRASGGVIRIYTHNGLEDAFESKNDSKISYAGYNPSYKFEDYWNDLSDRNKDNSNLIYWNPNLQLDEKGEAVIRLPNVSDSSVLKASCSLLSNGAISTIETSITY